MKHLIDGEDLVLLGRGAILLCLAAGVLLSIAAVSGLAWRVFQVVGGA